MCGIIAGTTRRPISNILIEGLERLEYRGYDSAGVCIQDKNNKNIIVKEVGKVEQLRRSLKKSSIDEGFTGIAHTRWATHGFVNKSNSHPHYSDNIAVVHNGIIENYKTIKEQLISEGYIFSSETDSEVIAHLIYKYTKTVKTLLNAVMYAIKELEGSFSLVILSEDEPNTLIGVKSGSPLVIGLGFEENFLASDAMALAPFTQQCIYLDDGEVVSLNFDNITIYDKDSNILKKNIVSVNIDSTTSSKGKYKHFMEKELDEAPIVAKNLINQFIQAEEFIIPTNMLHFQTLYQNIEEIHIISCGGSMHAAIYGEQVFQEILNIPTHIYVSSEYRYYPPIVRSPKKTLFISISQSGETSDTIGALTIAKSIGYSATLSICNVESSTLARESDYIFNIEAGIEIGVASTKALTNQMVSMVLIPLIFNKEYSNIQTLKYLVDLPNALLKVNTLKEQIKQISDSLRHSSSVFFIGRGLDYSVAREAALKLKEITYIYSEAYPSGELKHGPLALMEENVTVISLSTDKKVLSKTLSNLEETRSRGVSSYSFICDTFDKASEDKLLIPDIGSMISPIVMCHVVQILSYETAILLGTDADQPRNLAKSVTVE